MLKQTNAEYQTAHFGKWDHRYDEVSPEEMGYDISDGVTGNSTGGAKDSGGPAAKDDPKLIFSLTERACAFMEKQANAGKPFYLQVSHYAVHLDIFYRKATFDAISQRKTGEKHKMPEFAAMTEDLDKGVGALLDKIDELGLRERTYIIFMSDNGGRTTLPGASSGGLPLNYPLRDGKGSMYEGGIRVPFVVVGPGVKAGSVCRVPVTGLDVLPTVADLAGYRPRLPDTIDGGSLKGILNHDGQGNVERRLPFLIFHQAADRDPKSALRLGDYKLVKSWSRNKVELFDLSHDLGERNDLSRSLPKKTDELHSLMTDFLKQVAQKLVKRKRKPRTRIAFHLCWQSSCLLGWNWTVQKATIQHPVNRTIQR